jgi:hypothetical protein
VGRILCFYRCGRCYPLGEDIAAAGHNITNSRFLVLEEPQLPTSAISPVPLPENARPPELSFFVDCLIPNRLRFLAGSSFPAIIAAVFATGWFAKAAHRVYRRKKSPSEYIIADKRNVTAIRPDW